MTTTTTTTIAETDVCPELAYAFGTRRATDMTAMLVRVSGHGCPCTYGERCMFKPDADFIPVVQAAREAGVDPRRVGRAVKSDRLGSVTWHYKVLVRTEDVRELFAA